MGSGTTGIVANRVNCNFIGCELDTQMFNTARERIISAKI